MTTSLDELDNALTSLRQGPTFDDYCKRRSAVAYELLGQLLTDLTLQQRLSAEFLVSRSGYPLRSEYPSWARQVAHTLLDPAGQLECATKEGIWNLLVELRKERHASEDDRVVTRTLRAGHGPRFMRDLAAELCAMSSSANPESDHHRSAS